VRNVWRESGWATRGGAPQIQCFLAVPWGAAVRKGGRDRAGESSECDDERYNESAKPHLAPPLSDGLLVKRPFHFVVADATFIGALGGDSGPKPARGRWLARSGGDQTRPGADGWRTPTCTPRQRKTLDLQMASSPGGHKKTRMAKPKPLSYAGRFARTASTAGPVQTPVQTSGHAPSGHLARRLRVRHREHGPSA
jgi:hypothetical protein